MNWKPQADHVDAMRAGQIERLVCGELDEQSRRTMIAWLDEDLRRWRACGLLFLESQAWSQAMTDWPVTPVMAKTTDYALETASITRGRDLPWRPRRSMAYAVALAASVIVSFLVGFAVRGASRDPQQDVIANDISARRPSRGLPHDVAVSQADRATVMATLPVESRAGARVASTVHIPVVREEAASADAGRLTGDIPDYIRQQWRRRGYELNVQRRYLFGQLPDGERVAVPVDQYSFTHVPPKIN